MPTILDLNLLSRFPMPTVKYYAAFSAVLLSVVIYRTQITVGADESWNDQLTERVQNDTAYLSDRTKQWLVESYALRCLYFLITDPPSTWVLINSFCCLVAIIGSLLRWLVFGKLRASEAQQLQDRFWSFVFSKFVFVFGILNAEYVDEVMCWCMWFMFIALFHLLIHLAQDRFKYMWSSRIERGHTQHIRILVLMSMCFIWSCGLFAAAGAITYKFGLSYGALLAADSLALIVRSLYCCVRYGLYLYDIGRERSDQRLNYIYHIELYFEVVLLVIDIVHHTHMLIWSNIILSLASLVVLMQLKQSFQQLDKRLKRHAKFKRIVKSMDDQYPTIRDSTNSAEALDDTCAICWDPLEPTARQLPCRHAFHHWCLLGWLQQDASCPTCRMAIPIGPSQPAPDPVNQRANGAPAFSHIFRFDGRRYARWLPTFSVQVSHDYTNGLGLFRPMNRAGNIVDSRFIAMANEVHELFPQVEVTQIAADLQANGGQMNVTINNILDGQLFAPDHHPNLMNAAAAAALLDDDTSSGDDEEMYDDDDEELDGDDDSDASRHGDHHHSDNDQHQNGDHHDHHNQPGGERRDPHDDAAVDRLRVSQFDDHQHQQYGDRQRRNNGDPHHENEDPSTSMGTSSAAMGAFGDTGSGALGGRFSKESNERETMLQRRRRELIQEQRDLYLRNREQQQQQSNSASPDVDTVS